MGMFDNVKDFTMKCPGCGELLNHFQSKDGPCELIDISFTRTSQFYDYCQKCQAWVEFTREDFDWSKPDPTVNINDFKKTVRLPKT